MLSDSPRLTRTHYTILLLAWAGWMFDFYDLILYVFLKESIGHSLHLGSDALRWVGQFQLLATGLGGIAAGWLADRFGRKPVLQITILLYCLGTCLCAFAQSEHGLLFARIVTGIGVGGEWAIGHTLLGEVVPAARRGRMGALLQTGAPLGVFFANLMGSFLAPWADGFLSGHALWPYEGWRAAFLLSALPALIVIAIRRWMPESDLWQQRRSMLRSGEAPWQEQRLSTRNTLLQLLGGDLAFLTVAIFLLTFVNGASYWLTYFYFPDFLQHSHHLDIQHAGWWLFIVIVGELIGYAAFGFVADRVGRRPTFTLFAWTMAAGLLSIGTQWRGTEDGIPAWVRTALFGVGIGTGTWSCFGPLFAELFPTRVRNTASGAIFNLSRSAQFFSLWALALFPKESQLSAIFVVGGSCAAAAGFMIWLLPETCGKALHAVEDANFAAATIAADPPRSP